jgi:hypothetical protein
MVMSGMENRRALFEKAKPYLLNPVRKKIYSDFNAMPNGLPKSGLSALSELSMLNPDTVKTYAFFGKVNTITGIDTLIDSNVQAEIEIWRYTPTLLSECPDMVDTLSLITSMQYADDERIEQAIDEILFNLWR